MELTIIVMKWSGWLAGSAALALALAGCAATPPAQDGTVSVVAGFYPLQYLAERIGGPGVVVTSLAQPGAEPHDLELTPRQLARVATADLVLYLRTLQPAVDDAVGLNAPARSLDLLSATSVQPAQESGTGTGTGPVDPHVWLDPVRYAQLADVVAARLSEVDPAHAGTYRRNGATLAADLTRLDGDYAAGLAHCRRNQIVTTHTAFGYLAGRYGLTQVGIAGLSPEEEPSPRTLDQVRRFAAANGITTIFYEDQVSPQYADTVAQEVGARTAVLSPVEVVAPGKDYLSAMRTNLATLRAALDCI